MVDKATNELLDAIEFCVLANNASPDIAYTSYCCLSAETGTVYMSDGIVSCGCLCHVEITTSIEVKKLLKALKAAKSGYTFTILDNSSIALKSGRLKAVIPTIDYIADKLYPDPILHSENVETFIRALTVASAVTKDKASHIVNASVLVYNTSCYGTDTQLLIEYWHGIPISTELTIPKTFIAALSKIKKLPVGIGYSKKSLTVWFNDRSWIRTQLYENSWPVENVLDLFKPTSTYLPIHTELGQALEELSAFVGIDGRILLSDNHISSSNKSSYDIDVYVQDVACNCKLLQIVCKYATGWDVSSRIDRHIAFVGENLRGLLCIMV